MIRKGIIVTRDGLRILGGQGSGNFGHAGIPGQRGGSAAGTGGGGGGSSGRIPQKFTSTKEDYFQPSDFTDDGFSEDQAGAIIYYKEEGFAEMRKVLTGKSQDPKATKAIKDLDSAIDVSELPEDVTVYHGMGEREAAKFDKLKPGSEFTYGGFYSTSRQEEVGNKYAEGKRVLKINSKAGQKGIYTKDPDYEDEVIFGRGTTYSVTDVYEKGGITYYETEIR